jgi:NADH-quinone oxidoreductase subunit E
VRAGPLGPDGGHSGSGARPAEDRQAALAKMVRRFEHGSRVPGWDEAVDLTKDPATVPDPAQTPVPDELRELIEEYMGRYPDVRSASIPALRAAQRHYGWLPPHAIEQVAAVMRLTPGYLIAVATFYDMFETDPVGEHTIYVCTNISCALRGGDDIYEAMREAGGDRTRFNVRSFECLGACDIAPMASVGGTYVGPLTREDVPVLFEQLAAGEEVLPDKQLLRRKAAVTHWEGERTGGRAAKGPTAATNDVEGPGEI